MYNYKNLKIMSSILEDLKSNGLNVSDAVKQFRDKLGIKDNRVANGIKLKEGDKFNIVDITNYKGEDYEKSQYENILFVTSNGATIGSRNFNNVSRKLHKDFGYSTLGRMTDDVIEWGCLMMQKGITFRCDDVQTEKREYEGQSYTHTEYTIRYVKSADDEEDE